MNNIIVNYLRPDLFCYNVPAEQKHMCPGRGKAVSAGLLIDDIIGPRCGSGRLEHLRTLVNSVFSSRKQKKKKKKSEGRPAGCYDAFVDSLRARSLHRADAEEERRVGK